MKILVCFKAVADVSQLPQQEWQSAIERWSEGQRQSSLTTPSLSSPSASKMQEVAVVGDHPLSLGWLRQQFNPYDESALELTLRCEEHKNAAKTADSISSFPSASVSPPSVFINEKVAADITMQAVTVGNSTPDTLLRQVMALGFSPVTRLTVTPADITELHPDAAAFHDARFTNAHDVALGLAHYAQQQQMDVIMLGQQSAVGGSGETGYLLAEHLGYPCLEQVVDFHVNETPFGSPVLHVTTVEGEMESHYEVEPPVVLLVGNVAGAQYLRIPSLKQKLEAKKQPLITQSIAISPSSPCLNETTLTMKQSQRQTIWVEMPSATSSDSEKAESWVEQAVQALSAKEDRA
ncbi:hypothetical protein ACFFLZ_04830 [Photobacterium aphoticum]|uniref:Electron transfer flavoprotein alpha/beta-subunit N-terminal domain-containing protein n=1 Tax=Photobacterium aphoticum TaxID=754436 RepID=A0A0J1JIH1_9GAMM|nr:hypothetical protein [Photobacterium aphoticum]KLV01747.1 hypothetical protein ABT58_04740 [Photobacterium aphoticum]PSU58775.1 hypothetical protein C9I90_06020 [Photobacterium aphoticum]GHA32058.1 hypothetical protein GCM10007086_01470 [Photobacterium aphoticum]